MSHRPPRFVEHVAAAMDTAVSIQIVEPSASSVSDAALRGRATDAWCWFAEVEATCSRFDPDSELSRLSHSASQHATPVPVSPMLFEVLRMALTVAALSDGAFDPTVGHALHALGFDRHWRTGARVEHAGASLHRAGDWRDITLDADHRSVTFARPLTLDLGGIAKGFAIDLAARELADLPAIAINAGGDVFVRGLNPHGAPWRIGIRDPFDPARLVSTVHVTDGAICTSGSDQRRRGDGQHHLLDPRTGRSAMSATSVTVLAPLAVIADALATAAFVLGPPEGLALLEREQVQGMFIDGAGALTTTKASPLGSWATVPDEASAGADLMTSHAPR